MVLACWHLLQELVQVRPLPDKTTLAFDAYSAWKAHWSRPTTRDELVYPKKKRPRRKRYNNISNIYHIPLKYVVHDLVALQSRSIDQQLESEFQTRIHLPATRLSLAFFSSSLCFHIVVHFARSCMVGIVVYDIWRFELTLVMLSKIKYVCKTCCSKILPVFSYAKIRNTQKCVLHAIQLYKVA